MIEKTIFSKWLAFELRKAGFQIIRTEINENHPQFECWVFEYTPEFEKAFVLLSQKRK